MAKKVVVVGGGLGGMSAAIKLAGQGYQVTILEKNERAGGKLNIRSGKGYTFDTGPSILSMPWVLEQLFQSVGRNVHDYLDIVRVEPQWRTFYEDGTSIDLMGDLPRMLEQLKHISPKDAEAFFAYMDYAHRMYELTTKSFYKRSLSGLNELRSMHTWKELMNMDPMRSMDQATRKYFSDKRIQQLFNFLLMYVGSSPYHAPAVMSQLSYVQLGLGIYYVQGGMYKIAEAMLAVLEELDVTVKVNSRVTQIVTQGTKVTGVELENGECISADLVVSNLEAIPAYETILDEFGMSQKAAQDLEKYVPTVSGLVLLLGVDKIYDSLAHHNFFFSEDPEREFHQIFNEGVPADDPTVYIGISSKSDASQAPAGKENLFILSHVPPLKKGETWSHYKEVYRETVLSKLERMGVHDLRAHIEFEYSFTPDDLRQLYGANGGSIYGVASDRRLNGGFKIPSRSKVLENLYFAGGSTHPGGGVPMVTLSGQLTADLIIEDHGMQNRNIG